MSGGAPVLASVEEYLRHSEKPTTEYRDGVISPKPLPTLFHSQLEAMLVLLLRRVGVETAHELTVRISPTKLLVPDVVAASVLTYPYPTEPVLLCCEILSPEDRLGAMFAKCEEYHAWSVPYCWVIDPVKRTAWEFHAETGEPVRVSQVLTAGEIRIDLAELFSALEGK